MASRPLRAARRLAKRVLAATGRRSPAVKRLTQRLRASRRRAAYREICRRNPIEAKTVVFESYVGSGFACSPKAIYQAMVRDPAFDDYTLIWAFKDPDAYSEVSELERAAIVRWGSDAHLAAYARAKHWICNCAVPAHVAPRDGQVYLQTWHGTPLKRFGCDFTPPGITTQRAVDERLQRWRASAAKFTFLLSQSPFGSEKLTSALGLEPASAPRVILESGYPRNDFLATSTAADAESIKRRLDVPDGKTVVLYAPTWRDDQRTPGVGLTLELGVDFDRLRRELGEDYVILFRAHFMIAESFDFERFGGFVRDVSRVDDVNDLYVVSDVLVTDYSSVFFDYANLERPVVFYMYDLDDYSRDRGEFYLELEELPGPVVRDQDGLAPAIVAATSAGTVTGGYRAFRERFTPWDDGCASERVIERVFRAGDEDGRHE